MQMNRFSVPSFPRRRESSFSSAFRMPAFAGMAMALGMLLAAGPAYALDLTEARSMNKVCEQADGYIKPVTADTKVLAAEVNAKRKAEYTRISQQNKQPVDVVGKLAAQQIVKNGAKPCS